LYPDGSGPRKVFAVNLKNPPSEGAYKLFDASDSGSLSLQEQLRRERMRLFTNGIASYEWSSKSLNNTSDGQKLLVPLGGRVLLYEKGECRVVYDASAGEAIDPHLSPDGSAVAFVINDDLYALQVPPMSPPMSPGEEPAAPAPVAPLRLTFNGAKTGVTCGLADYLAQEEMDRYV
jgi:dipeptidyl-peptidase 4